MDCQQGDRRDFSLLRFGFSHPASRSSTVGRSHSHTRDKNMAFRDPWFVFDSALVIMMVPHPCHVISMHRAVFTIVQSCVCSMYSCTHARMYVIMHRLLLDWVRLESGSCHSNDRAPAWRDDGEAQRQVPEYSGVNRGQREHKVALGDIQQMGVVRCSLDSCLLLFSFFAWSPP